MIIVSTNQREAGPALHAWGQALAVRVQATAHLQAPVSTAAAVQWQLNTNPKIGLSFFGHGLDPPAAGFEAQDGAAAVDVRTIGLLAGRTVAATCCHGDQLGMLAASAGFSIFGYAGVLQVPTYASHIQEMMDAALTGPEVLAKGGTPAQAQSAAAAAYSELAYRLYNQGRPLDEFLAGFAMQNAAIAGAW